MRRHERKRGKGFRVRAARIGAALAMATIPTLVVYIFLSKQIQESFIAGAVKG